MGREKGKANDDEMRHGLGLDWTGEGMTMTQWAIDDHRGAAEHSTFTFVSQKTGWRCLITTDDCRQVPGTSAVACKASSSKYSGARIALRTAVYESNLQCKRSQLFPEIIQFSSRCGNHSTRNTSTTDINGRGLGI